ncbi:MAG TPA: helix-turn-helix transcriptional regulator [candidate division Zixibacteria bacterium]|nr:helix-turn-helix transcriptional regulator [candidate division Zixibacteria bacterium]
MYTNLPRAVRFLRLRKGWSQAVLATRAGVSRELVSRIERDRVAGITFGGVDRVLAALDANLRAMAAWQGEQLDRLMDAGHAALQQVVAEMLATLGWSVRAEVSFNRYGDRGRVDLVAFHPIPRVVLLVEVKTALGDLQETLGRLDVKARIGRPLAQDLGWTGVLAVIPVLVIADARPARRVVASHSALFSRFSLRGRQAMAWLRRPVQPPPTGILWFANRPDSHEVTIARRKRAPKRLNSDVA